MKRKITYGLLTILLLTGCNEQTSTVKDTTVVLEEGKLIYSVSSESPLRRNWKFEVLFDQDNAVITEKYAFGAGNKYIYDKKSEEILGLIDGSLFFGIWKNYYFIYYTPEEFIKEGLSSSYGDTTIIETQEYKDILNYKCQKFIIKHGNQVEVEVWLTDKINVKTIYPFTPLTFDKVALEYELKILGKTDIKYKIKSISDDKIDKKEFGHIVPDPYYLVIPNSVFAIDSLWAKEYEENTFQSFTYPYYGNNREETIEIVKNGLDKIIPTNGKNNISVDFFVNKDGTISELEITINYGEEDKRIAKIKTFFESMKNWTPAKVKGRPVKSQVTIRA